METMRCINLMVCSVSRVFVQRRQLGLVLCGRFSLYFVVVLFVRSCLVSFLPCFVASVVTSNALLLLLDFDVQP